MSSISRASAKLDFPLPFRPTTKVSPGPGVTSRVAARPDAAEAGNRNGAQIGPNRLARSPSRRSSYGHTDASESASNCLLSASSPSRAASSSSSASGESGFIGEALKDGREQRVIHR